MVILICAAHALKHNTTLSELRLRGCGLSDEAICELCGGLKWCKLKKLDLGANPFGDQGAKGLADVLQDHPTLEELDMYGCGEMSDDGVQYLMDAMMSNTRVKMLRLHFTCEHFIVPQELDKFATRVKASYSAIHCLIRRASWSNAAERKSYQLGINTSAGHVLSFVEPTTSFKFRGKTSPTAGICKAVTKAVVPCDYITTCMAYQGMVPMDV
ncbi:hypothetical protein EMCRGX_G007751 [Ephydatia muelleri]